MGQRAGYICQKPDGVEWVFLVPELWGVANNLLVARLSDALDFIDLSPRGKTLEENPCPSVMSLWAVKLSQPWQTLFQVQGH